MFELISGGVVFTALLAFSLRQSYLRGYRRGVLTILKEWKDFNKHYEVDKDEE